MQKVRLHAHAPQVLRAPEVGAEVHQVAHRGDHVQLAEVMHALGNGDGSLAVTAGPHQEVPHVVAVGEGEARQRLGTALEGGGPLHAEVVEPGPDAAVARGEEERQQGRVCSHDPRHHGRRVVEARLPQDAAACGLKLAGLVLWVTGRAGRGSRIRKAEFRKQGHAKRTFRVSAHSGRGTRRLALDTAASTGT